MQRSRSPKTDCPLSMPLAWYAVAASRSLKKGQQRTIKFLDQDWVLFRNQAGELGTVTRYCSHMGADLSRGCVSDKHLVCPLHRWRYDRNGECHATIPAPLAQQARLRSLATEEYAGIIFVFPLAAPLYQLPTLPNVSKPAISSTTVLQLPIHYLAPAVNTFDIAHYKVIHHRQMLQEPELYSNNPYHLGIEFTARIIPKRWQDRLMRALGVSTVDITIDCWGGSLLLMKNYSAKLGAIIAMQPNTLTSSTLYLTAFDTDQRHSLLGRLWQRLKLELSRTITIAFLKSDIPVLSGMLPRAGVLIPSQDNATKRFWQYFQQLPKTDSHNENRPVTEIETVCRSASR